MTDRDRNPAAPRAERDDSLLVRDTLAGDAYAFDELVERYQGKLFNLALGITGNSHDARDVVQNAFLKAYQSLARYNPAHKFFSWIYRIGFNESINAVNRRRQTVPLDVDTATTAAGPHQHATSRQAGTAIREVLGELTPDLRVTIVLRHFHGLTYREMSEVVGVPEERIKSRLFSARVKMRRRLAEMGLTPDNHA